MLRRRKLRGYFDSLKAVRERSRTAFSMLRGGGACGILGKKGVERMSRASGYFVFLVIYFIIAVIRGLSNPKNKKSGGSAGSTAASANRTAPPISRPAAPAVRPAASASRERKSADHELGEVNHQYSHVSDKRVEQVNAYLKAGLIDKTEYRQMLERYTREDQQFTDY